MHPIKRPKPGDTEEDLLREEKAFLEGLKARNVVPAATVVKTVSKDQVGVQKKEDVRGYENLNRQSGEIDEEQDGDEASAQIEHPVEAVLFEVKERAFDPQKLKEFGRNKEAPQVLRLQRSDEKGNNETGTRKKSLFARSFDARKGAREKASSENQAAQNYDDSSGPQNKGDHLAKRAVGDEIHPYLAGMTEEEILEEQRKLLERLDPKLVEFIKSGKHKKGVPMEVDSNSKSANNQQQDPPVQIDEQDLPINPKLMTAYPGMDKIELPKLEWAGVVKERRKLEDSQASNNARFDFAGVLLPERSNDPSTYERALHNHGEEMERPGYTVEELLTLARSVNIQQRSIALETLGHIFSQAHTGFYDEVLEPSIFNLMDYIDLIHTIRKGLDNLDSNTINSSLSCLAALLYPDLEEDCLDASHLWPDARPHPLLVTRSEETVKDTAAESELKDFEFLQMDLLDFLISRSDILVRIEYLITMKSDLFSEKGVTSLLKVLIRFARHSPSSVMKYERIMKYVTENYVTPNWMALKERDRSLRGIPLHHALKLVRILVESSVQNAMKLYNCYSILPSVMSYLAYDQWKEQVHVHEVENLVLEAFKIWIGFLSFGIAINEYLALFPVLMQFLTFYGLASELNSFDLHHSSHLFALLTQILCFGNRDQGSQKNRHSHWDLVKDAATSIEKHCIKTMKILASPHLQGTYSLDLAVLSLGKGLEFLSHCLKYNEKESKGQPLLPVIREFCNSKTYSMLTSNLTSHSTILLGDSSQRKSRYPSNYASVNGIQWRGELNPVMRPNSPYHFLKHFIEFNRALNEVPVYEMLINSNVQSYLSKLSQQKTKNCTDFFIRFELSCLLEILRTVPNGFEGKFLIAYNSVVHVPSCCATLFQDILRLALETCCNINDVEAVYQFFVSYFLRNERMEPAEEPATSSPKSTKVKFSDGGHPGDGEAEQPKVMFAKWTRKITEAHWVFHPLENLYKRVNSTPGYVRDNLSILEQETRGCLSFIYQCLQYHSDSILQTPQDLVTVYCRICRIFMLGSPSVYIDEVTIPKLKEILQILLNASVLKTSTKPIFSNHKPSSSAAVSFYDFYTELVNEYFDNSYFNEIFVSYLLLPLRSAEDSNVKTCFWGHEYLNCIKVTNDKVLVPLDYLTRHPERDHKMLMVYTNLLKRGVITSNLNPFLHSILTTHLKNSVEFMTEKLKSDFESLRI